MSDALLLAQTLYRPPIAMGWVLLVVLVVLFSAALAMRRERTRWTLLLRLCALAGLVYLLLGPSRLRTDDPDNSSPPRLTVLIDTSASMAQLDGATRADAPPISRLESVSEGWLNDEVLAELRRIAEVDLVWFDEQARTLGSDPDVPTGDGTHLIDTLIQTDADATLILSDGRDTSPRRPGDFTANANSAGRVFAVPVGSPRSSSDLSLQAWPASDRLFEDQATTITVALTQQGFDGRSAMVTLSHNNTIIERKPVTLDQPGMELSFDIAPTLTPGQTVEAHSYRASIALDQGEEAYTDNNAEDLFVQVSRGRVRVLLIEGEPYWDTRSLARLIGSHPRFDLTAVYGFGDERRTRLLGEQAQQGNDPTQVLHAFDIVILGQRVDRLVDEDFAQRLTAFVQDGGAVVFARSEPFDRQSTKGRQLNKAMETISPVTWGQPIIGAMKVRLSENDAGSGPLTTLQDEAVLSRLPGMLAATRIEGRKTASVVLLEQTPGDGGAPMAALTTLRVGSGVVMAVLTEGLWRWELLPGIQEDAEAQSLYGVFWVRALQWLASGGEFLPGQDIALEADRLAVEPGQAVTLTVSTRYIEAQTLALQLTALDSVGRTQPIQLEAGVKAGSYTASFTPTSPGVYRFELTSPGRDDLIEPGQPLTTRIAAVERSAERRDTSARPDLLKQLTEPTGGRCLLMDQKEPLLDYLQTLQALRRAEPGVDYDFNTTAVFVWIAGCFGLEWILRRRSGLR